MSSPYKGKIDNMAQYDTIYIGGPYGGVLIPE